MMHGIKNIKLFNIPCLPGAGKGMYMKCENFGIWTFIIPVLLMIVMFAGCGRSEVSETKRQSLPDIQTAASVQHDETTTLISHVSASHEFRGREVSLYMDTCDNSGRQIRSRRYGAVVLETDGSVHRYRSVENLVWDLHDRNVSEEGIEWIGIVDFISADVLMEPEQLIYHYSRNLPSPGGFYISALDPEAGESILFNIGEAYPGTRHSWDEIQQMILGDK
jgi:hypothetical protein